MTWRKHDDKQFGGGRNKGKKRKRPQRKKCDSIFGCFRWTDEDSTGYALEHKMRGHRI